MENKFEYVAHQFCEHIKEIAYKPENLANFECYLSNHFAEWMDKWANTPERITDELREFARMSI